jgi:hypothetical protein
MRLYLRGGVFWIDFWREGRRVPQSLATRDPKAAEAMAAVLERAESAMPQAVGRKLPVCGLRRGARAAAVLYTVIGTARLHGLDACACIADVSDKIARAWPRARLAELLPDAWALAHPDAPRSPLPA